MDSADATAPVTAPESPGTQERRATRPITAASASPRTASAAPAASAVRRRQSLPSFRRHLLAGRVANHRGVADLERGADLAHCARPRRSLPSPCIAPTCRNRAPRSGRRISPSMIRRRTLRVRVSSPSSASSSLCSTRKRWIWHPDSISSSARLRFTSSTWDWIVAMTSDGPQAPGRRHRRCCCARPSCPPPSGRY